MYQTLQSDDELIICASVSAEIVIFIDLFIDLLIFQVMAAVAEFCCTQPVTHITNLSLL